MAEAATYEVLRHMQGDKDYAPGDTRELTADEADHLVRLGVLRLFDGEKAAPAAKNKKAAAPKNKAGD